MIINAQQEVENAGNVMNALLDKLKMQLPMVDISNEAQSTISKIAFQSGVIAGIALLALREKQLDTDNAKQASK